MVKGDRENYCATPPFAQTVTDEEIKTMADAFKKADRASLFCKTVESNAYKPCEVFETSCSQQKRKHQQDESPPSQTLESLLIEKLFENVPKDYHPPANYNQQQLELVERTVGLTISSAKEICLNTIEQSKNPHWYTERSKRVTASIFGKVISRRKSMYPSSLVKSITTQHNKPLATVPKPLQWGIDNEIKAILKYEEDMLKGDGVVRSCGLVVSPKWPWLACSPDGVVVKGGVPVGCVEIKCPYASKDLNISEAVHSSTRFFLKQTENGWKLKEKHAYYYQCQGVVNILNLEWIDFVVYTNVDMHVE